MPQSRRLSDGPAGISDIIRISMSRDPSNPSTLDGSNDNEGNRTVGNIRNGNGVLNGHGHGNIGISDHSGHGHGHGHGNAMLRRQSGRSRILAESQSEAGQTNRTISARLNRTDITKPEGPLGEFRFMCGKFINHPYVEHFITFIIFCNTVLLVLSTFDFAKQEHVERIFNGIDFTFLAIFTFESLLQLIYHDIKLLKNRWLTFDLILVIASWVFQAFTVLRCLRILKIASKFEALQRLITALLDVIPNITAIFSLLLLVFYIFAVMFTTLFKDLELSRDYFSRLDKTLFSLFQFMTMDWQEAARECAVFLPWAPLLFVLFEIVSGFIVFNLIVAVLCEALGLLEKDSEEEEMQQQIERERIEAMNSLLERVEMIKKHQLKIQQTLREVSSAHEHNE